MASVRAKAKPSNGVRMARHNVEKAFAANVPNLSNQILNSVHNVNKTLSALSMPPLTTSSAVSLNVTAVTWNLFTFSNCMTGSLRRMS